MRRTLRFPNEDLYKAVTREPNDHIRSLVDSYRTAKGLHGADYGRVSAIDTGRASRIADAYHEVKHEPDHPHVKAAYDALKSETLDQFRHLMGAGYKFTPHTGGGEPYAGSREALNDLRQNKHLHFFPTVPEHGGAFGEGDAPHDHPLLEETGYHLGKHPLLYNDVFRIVHDVFGHGADGNQFGALGEENAWRKHAGMYSDLAVPALTSETRGQNSWVNYGKHIRREDGTHPAKGDPDWTHPAERPFADQKAGLLPPEFWKPEPMQKSRTFLVARRDRR